MCLPAFWHVQHRHVNHSVFRFRCTVAAVISCSEGPVSNPRKKKETIWEMYHNCCSKGRDKNFLISSALRRMILLPHKLQNWHFFSLRCLCSISNNSDKNYLKNWNLNKLVHGWCVRRVMDARGRLLRTRKVQKLRETIAFRVLRNFPSASKTRRTHADINLDIDIIF